MRLGPRWFARAGHLDHTDAPDMAGWDHGGGFSLLHGFACVNGIRGELPHGCNLATPKAILLVAAFAVGWQVLSANDYTQTPSVF
jgi:hypothetical protein